MNTWKEVKLKTLISEMGDGGTPSTIDENNFGGNIPWAVVEDVVPNIYKTSNCLTEKGYKSCSAKLWDVGTIILTTGATIGNVGIAHLILCTKQGITGILPNSWACNLFLKYWFEYNTNQLIRFAQGTTFKEIRTRALGNLRIKIPNPYSKESVTEQTAIASILSKVDEAIEATQNSIKAADKLKKALMQNLLTGKLKPDGTWRTEDEFYVDEKFGTLPLGWKRKQVKDVTTQVQYGLNISATEDGTCPMFRMNNIIKGKMVADPMVYVNLPEKEIERYRLEKGDILFNRTNSLDLVGKIGIFELEGEYVFASYLIRLKIDSENNPYFLNYYLNSYPGQCSLRAKATPAVSQANINAKSLRNTYVPKPPKNEQDEIVAYLDMVNSEKKKLQSKIQTIQRLKKSLMQNLLTGKVRLPAKFITTGIDVEKINELINMDK